MPLFDATDWMDAVQIAYGELNENTLASLCVLRVELNFLARVLAYKSCGTWHIASTTESNTKSFCCQEA